MLTVTLGALSNPTRRAILGRLKNGPASVAELAEPFRMSQQAVSKHLAHLERASLVRKRREGRKHICELTPEPLREIVAWAEDYRRHWERAFGRLHALLEQHTGEPQPTEER
jgi:DNA-binding transcriptional ArsR family regulator